eukprot:295000_1
MSKYLRCVSVFIGIIFTSTFLFNVISVVTYGQCKFDDTNMFIVILNTSNTIFIGTYNIYQLSKLYLCIHTLSTDIFQPLLEVCKSFTALSTVFIITWIIYYIICYYSIIFSSLHSIEWCYLLLPDYASSVITFSGIYIFTIIGIECSKLRANIICQSQSNTDINTNSIVSGSPFILFVLKWYSLTMAGFSGGCGSFYVWAIQD